MSDLLKLQPTKGRTGRILDILDKHGPLSVADLTHRCQDEGLWSDEDDEKALFDTHMREVQKVLREQDRFGLPRAGRTGACDEAGKEMWAQRALWDYEAYQLNVDERLDQRDDNHWLAIALCDECRARYGMAPVVRTPEERKQVQAAD